MYNIERISMKFGEGYHYHQQMNWLHFGRNCNTAMDDKGRIRQTSQISQLHK